jgi:hypothetical protein
MKRATFSAVIAGLLVALAATAASAAAALVTSVSGGGFVEDDRVQAHFRVDAKVGTTGATGQITLQAHWIAVARPDRVHARVTCVQSVGDVVLVGGTIVNPNAPAQDVQGLPYTHLILALEDHGETGDRATFGYFVDWPPETNPCAVTAPNVPSLVMETMSKGGITVSA